MSFDEILGLVRRVLPDGERIASRLAASRDPERVLDVLCDRPRVRVFAAPVGGLVDTSDGVLIRTGDRLPTSDERAESSEYAHGNPLGSWVGDDLGWLVPAPDTILIAAGTAIEAGTPVVTCKCTLDHIVEVSGQSHVVQTIEQELPELEADDALALATLMLSYVEEYASSDDLWRRVEGVLVRAIDFDAGNEQRRDVDQHFGRARVLGVPAIASLRERGPVQVVWRSPPERLLAALGVDPQPVADEQLVHVSDDAMQIRSVVGHRRDPPDAEFTGWVVVAVTDEVESAAFGYHTVRELAEDRPAWLAALCLPVGWSFAYAYKTLIECVAPDGTHHDPRSVRTTRR